MSRRWFKWIAPRAAAYALLLDVTWRASGADEVMFWIAAGVGGFAFGIFAPDD